MTSVAGVTSSPGRDEPALARVHVRFAAHKDFDRLVFKLPPDITVVSHQDGASLKLTFAESTELTGDAVVGQRILSMSHRLAEATMRLALNARVHSWRSNGMLVVDVFDPNTPEAGALPSGGPHLPAGPDPQSSPRHGISPRQTIAAALPPLAMPIPARMPTTGVASAATEAVGIASLQKVDPPAKSVSQAPSLPISNGVATDQKVSPDAQARLSHPVSITVIRDTATVGPALLVPFGRDVGAAAFLRGGEARVVFDAPQTFDLSGLKDDTAFGGVIEQLLPDGMQLRLKIGGSSELRVIRRDDGWVISLQSLEQTAARLAPIIGQNRRGVTALDASASGRVVVVNDELTGGRLLVGTQRSSGEHVVNSHSSAEATILPTWQGVVVQPTSDRVLLRATKAGFELSLINAPPLAMTWSDQQIGAWPDGRAMTRLFDLSNLPPEMLHRLLGQALRDAAAAPKLARFGPRLSVAKAMLAQGMDVEAASVLRTADADDPSGQDGRCGKCMAALASWMSARAGGVASPQMPIGSINFGDSDEAALLKALLQPGPDTAAQAAVVASTWPLLLSYPPTLHRFMLQPVADLLFRGGQNKALSAFLAAFPDTSLDLARAELLRSQGKIDDCLKLYDRVAGGRDRLARANALEQTVVAKLASNRISPAEGADALNSQLYAWRGGDRELRIRQQVAKLRVQAGQWRSALTMLEETKDKFPQSQAEVHAAKSVLVAELLKGDNVAKLSPIDLVAIADGTSDVFQGNDDGFAPAMIDKLLALDLAGRADQILRRLFEGAKDGRTKAELGIRLAGSILDGGDPAAALAVLASPDDAELGAAVVSRRKLLRSHFFVQSGKLANALEALSGLHSREASELEATIREGQHDWTNAVGVLKPFVFDASFASTPQEARRDLVLRLARDEAEAGDQAGLHALRQAQGVQFQTGSEAALFSVLTAEPVHSTADLPRSATELHVLQSLPSAIARAGSS